MTNKVLSLGSDCSIATLLRSTLNYTTMFDWMQSQRLSGIVEYLEEELIHPFGEGCHLYSEERKDLYNTKFNFRLPHEQELFDENEARHQIARDRWARRYERWQDNKKQDDPYIFIRKIYAHPYGVVFKDGSIVDANHDVMGEDIPQNYSKDVYDRLQQHLPKNNKIIVLVTDEGCLAHDVKKTAEITKSIYDGFIVQNLYEIYPDFKPIPKADKRIDLWFKDHMIPSQIDMDRVCSNRS